MARRYRTPTEALHHAYWLHWNGQSKEADKLMEVIINFVVPQETSNGQTQKPPHQAAQTAGGARG